jgi:hypothetical protein
MLKQSKLRLTGGAALIAVTIAVGVAAFGTGTASAGIIQYCTGTYAGFQTCPGADHSLTDNYVFNTDGIYNRVCAGAWQNGVFYGSYFCAAGYACHDYGGSNVLTPASHNGIGSPQNMSAYESYGVDRLSNCPHGSASAAGKVVATPFGKATITRQPRTHRVCLRMPDPVSGYGYTCASSKAAARGQLAGALVPGPGSKVDRTVVVALVPKGSKPTLMRADGTRQRLVPHDGVLTVSVSGARKLELRPPHAKKVTVGTAPIKGGRR